MNGTAGAGAVRLDGSGPAAAPWAVVESVANALAVRRAAGDRLAGIVALTGSAWTPHRLPDAPAPVILIPDPDAGGSKAVRSLRAANRRSFAPRPLRAVRLEPGADCADLAAAGRLDELRRAVLDAAGARGSPRTDPETPAPTESGPDPAAAHPESGRSAPNPPESGAVEAEKPDDPPANPNFFAPGAPDPAPNPPDPAPIPPRRPPAAPAAPPEPAPPRRQRPVEPAPALAAPPADPAAPTFSRGPEPEAEPAPRPPHRREPGSIPCPCPACEKTGGRLRLKTTPRRTAPEGGPDA